MNENNKRILTSKMDAKVLERFENKPSDISLDKIKKPNVFINRVEAKIKEVDKAKEIEKLYQEGKENLKNEYFDNAITIFEKIKDYKDCNGLLNIAIEGKAKLDKRQNKLYMIDDLKFFCKRTLYYLGLFLPVLLYILVVVLSGVYYEKLQVFSHSLAFLLSSIVFLLVYILSFLFLVWYIGGSSERAEKNSKIAFTVTHLLASFAIVISFFATSSRVFTFDPFDVDISLVYKRYDSNKTTLMFKATNNSNAEIIHIDFYLQLFADGNLIRFLNDGYLSDHDYVTTYDNCGPNKSIYFEEEIKTSYVLNDTPFSKLSAKIYQLNIEYDSYIDNWVTFNDPDLKFIKKAD